MKIRSHFQHSPTVLLVMGLAGFVTSVLADDPRAGSWFTADTGKYARIYTNDAAKAAGSTVTTWSNGTQTQSSAAYSGVQEISSSSNWIYLRTTGLGQHIMGPWQNGSFPNLPINTKTLWRIPTTNTVPAAKTLTGNGPIGYFVDGVSMFDSRDAFYWNGSGDTQGTGYWNRDAYVNEGATFDPAYAHQPQDGTYHYHADPIALRHLLGDHVDYDSTAKTYSEATNAVTKHSPILAWVSDGCPLYGPYGYANATNPAGGVRRMVSGYVLRNGQLGTSNLTANGRTTIPLWAVRLYGNVASNILAGPAVGSSYPLGRYMEDNDYLGDLGFQQGVDFDLDVYNGRWCVTPEFPGGIYAYFVAISSNGTPVFPYNIGRAYYGNPTGGAVTSISETVVTNFEGGPNSTLALSASVVTNGAVTLVWSSVEGGTYQVLSTTNLVNWTTNLTGVASQGLTTQTNLSSSARAAFFGVALTALAAYDPVSGSAGGGATSVVPGGSASTNSTVTVTITLPNSPPWPPANAPISSVKLAGTIVGTSVSDPTQGTVTATFAIPSNAPTGAQTVQVIFNAGPTYTFTGGFTIN